MDKEKLDLILNHKLVPSQRTSDMISNKLGILYLYTYQESDCNLVFDFDVDKKFNMLRQLTPELCPTTNIRVNGKQANAFQSALARAAWEHDHAYKAGSCRILKDAVSRFIDKGGNKLSLDEIKAYLSEDAAAKAQSEKEKAEQSESDVKNADVKTADSNDLKNSVDSLEEVKALLKHAMEQNAKQ